GPRDPPPIGRSEERPSIGRAMPAPTRGGGCTTGIGSAQTQQALGRARTRGEGLERAATAMPARPLRLFAWPEPIETVAEVPDGPPLRFRWRRVLHNV